MTFSIRLPLHFPREELRTEEQNVAAQTHRMTMRMVMRGKGFRPFDTSPAPGTGPRALRKAKARASVWGGKGWAE